MCPLVKSSYGFAISDRCPFFHFADLVIGETTCDGKKKMYELMSEFKPVHVMELPNSQSERGLVFWKSEIIRTKEYLEEFFHIVITEEMIRDAVHLNNEIRMSLKNLCELMKLDPAPVKGEDIQKMVQGSKYRFDFATTPGVVKEVIDKIMTEYRQGKHLEKRPRILVTGCPIGGDSLKVIRAIEDNGGVVVAIENCSGVRTLGNPVEEDCEDIYEAIARKYLSTGCSIMTPNDNRIDLIGEIIDEYHVDGVVEMILTGCHATGAESVYIRKFVTEEKHLPYIAIDTDYSTADQGQIATRLTAFLEMIQPGTDEDLDINYCYKIVLAGMTDVNPDHLRINKPTGRELGQLEEAALRLKDLPFYLDYTVGATVEQIRAKVLLQCRLGKCDLVVVDYLHLLGGDRRKGETQEQMVGRNVRALKQLALDSNCPVLTVSQMNRACEARADKAYLPVMSDLRDSGTIEQVADCVAFIYRPERYGFTRDEKTGHSLVGVGKIYIAKNRNGSTGIARFRYNPSFTRITDYIQPGTQTSLGL